MAVPNDHRLHLLAMAATSRRTAERHERQARAAFTEVFARGHRDQAGDARAVEASLRAGADALARSAPCTTPPAGWTCSREGCRAGPCAARPLGPSALLRPELRADA